MSGPLVFEDEELRLVREYERVRRRESKVEAEIGEYADVAVGEGAAARQVMDENGVDEVLASWVERYPSLAETDVLVMRIDISQAQLVAALTSLPPMPEGKLAEEDAIALRAIFRPVQKAVSLFARYVWAVASLRSVVAHTAGEEDETPVDAYAIAGAILKLAVYTNYDRIRVKLSRRSARVKKRIATYNAKPENVARRAAWVKAKRVGDADYRARENERRRKRYKERRAIAVAMATVLASVDAEVAT